MVFGHHLQSLELSDFSQLDELSPISSCSQLTRLKVRSFFPTRRGLQAIDLRPLSSCKLLTDVDLHGCRCSLSDLSPLAACVHIKSLCFSSATRICDVSPLSSLVQLTYLHLGSPNLRQMDALAACTRLTTLKLITYYENPPLTPLASCQRLRSLYLRSFGWNGDDLLPLAKCSSLEELTLEYCHNLSDVGALQELPRLHSLKIWGCGWLTDVSPLSHCMKLRSLVVGGCRVGEKSISALRTAKPELSVTVY